MTSYLKTALLFIGLLLVCSCDSKHPEEGNASAEAAAQEKVAAGPRAGEVSFHHLSRVGHA